MSSKSLPFTKTHKEEHSQKEKGPSTRQPKWTTNTSYFLFLLQLLRLCTNSSVLLFKFLQNMTQASFQDLSPLFLHPFSVVQPSWMIMVGFKNWLCFSTHAYSGSSATLCSWKSGSFLKVCLTYYLLNKNFMIPTLKYEILKYESYCNPTLLYLDFLLMFIIFSPVL